ncbi:MAG: hypothetical protein LBC98_07865, partial [Prevotellaceae bacterium]|nr:hypothetical protein [Prevotellaceae bacterium]
MSNNYFLKSGRIILIIAIVIVTVSIICAYIRNTSDRLYFSITQFDLPERKLFNIGKNSDVCYAGVPENYMSVEYKDGGFSYKINHTDSCLYYKINNKNPNSHIFSENSTVRIFGINYQAKDVINFLKDFKNEYFMLNDVLAVVDTNWTTSVHHQAITSGDSYFNSFLYRKGGKGAFSIIILDKHTILNDTIRYCDASEHLSNSQQSAELKQSLKNTEFKIQFFKMKSWSTKRQKKGYLYNNERSYFAKSEQMFTEWGAGHILIKRNENNFSVTFPKAITTTIARKKVEETIKASQVGVYLKQMLKSYPMPTDFYIPDFSNALSEYVCELTPDKLIFQESNKRDTVTLQTSGSIIPQIDIKDQTLELGKIRYKARILNASFYWSKHYVLFLVWLVLAGILFLAFPVSGTEKVKDVRYYITGMFTLFWFFLNQKLLIAEKLTFTYPYFEKIYPVSYLTNLFSLFAVFLLILLINKVYFKVVKSNEKGFKNNDYLRWKFSSKRRFLKKWNAKLIVNFDSWFWKTVLVGGIIATCYFAVNKININFISPIWSSYLSGEISIFNPLSDAMNDNHFTVCLMAGAL